MVFKSKKAEMGIGTLIIFIAMLLVAAVAAGVLIQTNASLQEKALTTGDQAKGQISTNVRVIEVSATDGSNGDVETFNQIVKLSPGSEPVKLAQVLLTLNTFDSTTTLTYLGTNGNNSFGGPNGYNTFRDAEISAIINGSQNLTLDQTDNNADGVIDILGFIGGGNNLGYHYNSTNYTVLGTCAAGGAITAFVGTAGDGFRIDSAEQAGSPCTGAAAFDTTGSANNLTLTPVGAGAGNFTVTYLQRGSNPVDGNLQRGDVIRIYYQAPRNITEDEEVRINFIPKIGTPTLTQFITPEVISEERIYLYP